MLRYNRICEERPSGETVSLFSAKRTAGGFAGSSGNTFAKVSACISSRGGVKCNVVRKKEV